MTVLTNRKAVIAKLGMDAHWRGAIVVANALRNSGMEVVYVGHATADGLANCVVQEDAELVGISSLSGSHRIEVPAAVKAIRDTGSDAIIVVGGAIPEGDRPLLLEAGVAGVFPTGTPLPEIVQRCAELISAHQR